MRLVTIVENTKTTFGIWPKDLSEPLLEAGNREGSIRVSRELQPRVQFVEILTILQLQPTVDWYPSGRLHRFVWKIRVTKEAHQSTVEHWSASEPLEALQPLTCAYKPESCSEYPFHI